MKGPENVKAKCGNERIVKSTTKLEGVHRYVEHKTESGKTIRTDKDGTGAVHWAEAGADRTRATSRSCHKQVTYPKGQGPTVSKKIEESRNDHGSYDLLTDNCGDYSDKQLGKN